MKMPTPTSEPILKSVILVLITVLVLSALGCVTVPPVSEDYSPRLSSQAMSIEQQVQSLGIESPLLVLECHDGRASQASAEAKPDSWLSREAVNYKDPHFVWSQKFSKYSLAGKTLGQYVSDALAFDMQRTKLPALRASSETSAFSGSFEGNAYDQRFVLGIDILRFRPDFKMGFYNVKPLYIYTLRTILWDSSTAQVILDKTIDKTIETTPVPGITFADTISSLMNDRLTEVNMEIIKIVAQPIAAAE